MFRNSIFFLFIFAILYPICSKAQTTHTHHFTRADTLRGALRAERTCYDVTFYKLTIEVNPNEKSINGTNEIHFNTMADFKLLQIDLFENLKIEKIVFQDKDLKFNRVDNAVFINFPKQLKGSQSKFTVHYNGQPTVAENPPWEGGFIWDKDDNNKDWVTVACQGVGASLWWPNKDHLSDEPDSMQTTIIVESDLMAVSNGRLKTKKNLPNNQTAYTWTVSYPINNYNLSLNIGDYTIIHDQYIAFDGSKLDLNYYVFEKDQDKAKKHFKQVHKILLCYELYFGKYPFWRDGFALIQTPYLGMEHQSGIAYGNDFQKGYLGYGLPENMNWDYVIVHEAGHEYFGNSLSCTDMAEIWLHESFTTYMEALYVECAFGYKDAIEYMLLSRDAPNISNKAPILGPMHVNWENWFDSDNYFKGAWILHTLRHVIDDDQLWFDLLKTFYEQHAYNSARTEDFTRLVNSCTGKNYDAFFDQYLRKAKLPTLFYKLEQIDKDLKITFKWNAETKGFNMPIMIGDPKNYNWVIPFTTRWESILIQNLNISNFKIAEDLFLVETKRVK